jgi:hypothetical protein
MLICAWVGLLKDANACLRKARMKRYMGADGVLGKPENRPKTLMNCLFAALT